MHASIRPFAFALAGCAIATACRVGGPSGELTFVAEGAAEGADASADGENGGASNAGASNSGTGTTGGTSTGGTVTPPDADGGDAGATSDAAPDVASSDPGPCVPDTPSAVCDPVCNTGCGALSRCDVADTPNTGRCIGIWISKEGEICAKTSATNNCAVQLTCHEGKCLHLCYHDSDCATATAGACCTVPIDMNGTPSGFKGCGACAP